MAERRLVGKATGGDSFEIVATIGAPFRSEVGDWACPVSLAPLFDSLPDIHGVDSFQALQLGLELIDRLLRDFVAKGNGLSLDGENFAP